RPHSCRRRHRRRAPPPCRRRRPAPPRPLRPHARRHHHQRHRRPDVHLAAPPREAYRMTVEARDIHFAYRPREPVLKGVTASARAGRITAVVGPNAAGKTTLLKVLLGLLEPDRGIALL